MWEVLKEPYHGKLDFPYSFETESFYVLTLTLMFQKKLHTSHIYWNIITEPFLKIALAFFETYLFNILMHQRQHLHINPIYPLLFVILCLGVKEKKPEQFCWKRCLDEYVLRVFSSLEYSTGFFHYVRVAYIIHF